MATGEPKKQATGEPKKRVFTSYERLTPELLELFQTTYPHGYIDSITEVQKPNGQRVYAVYLETEEASYLVKVDVKVDSGNQEEEDNQYGEGDTDSYDSPASGDREEEEDSSSADSDQIDL